MSRIAEASAPQDVAKVRELFAEYARAVAEPCCFADFERELAALPAGYQLLLLAGDAAGCVGVRRLDAATAEIKRLYVRPQHRGQGLGRALAETSIAWARTHGYSRVVLDTLPKMGEARALYRQLQFEEVPPYLPVPTPGAICFALSL
jgi:GNAT superfamily N-acetyltransferase